MDAEVLIQAGHQGGQRNYGAGATRSVGTAGEQERNPVVADHAATLLRDAGVTVIREDAFFDKVYEVKLAVAVHFDGSTTPCASGASIGYPEGVPAGSNKPAADIWRQIYGSVWPFKWMNDNFTSGLRGYYGYKWTKTEIAEMLIEFGELTCPEQKAWLDARIHNGYLGHLLAYAIWEIVRPGTTNPIGYPTEAEYFPPVALPEDLLAEVETLRAEVEALNLELIDVREGQGALGESLEQAISRITEIRAWIQSF